MNTLMTKTLSLIGLSALALGAAACGPPVPSQPTWSADVRPLLQARCVRCHDSPGRTDPASKAIGMAHQNDPLGVLVVGGNPSFNVDRDTFLTSLGGTSILMDVVRGRSKDFPIMPPPPAAPLSDEEIQILQNWANENPQK